MCVCSHRCTAGPGSQSGSPHIRHTVVLRTPSDTDTVPSPEHTRTALITLSHSTCGLYLVKGLCVLMSPLLLPCHRCKTESWPDHSCRADTRTLRPCSSIRPRTRRRGCPPPPSGRDTVLSASHRNRDSPEDSGSPRSPAGHRSTLPTKRVVVSIINQTTGKVLPTLAVLLQSVAVVTRFAVLAAGSHGVVEAAQAFSCHVVTGVSVIQIDVVVAKTRLTASTRRCQAAIVTRAASVTVWP